MHPAACHPVYKPGIHGTKKQLAFFRFFLCSVHVLQDPFDLGTGEIGVDQQARFLRHRFVQPIRLQPIADGGGPAALPHDGVAHRASGGTLPQDGRLPLVGDTQSRDLLGVDVGGIHRLRQSPLLRGPDLHGIVLHPAGLGIDLAEGILGAGHDGSGPVEQDGPGTGGPLVQCHDISLHKQPPLAFFHGV